LLQVPRPWREDSEERVYREALEQIVLADRLGFDYAWASEHHFLEEYSHCSAPEVFLAAAAALTSNIRLAHGIVSLPPAVNHPARVAERIAALDLISGGRVDFGTGQGSTQHELGAFGIARATKREQWREALEVILRMLTEEPFTGYKGTWVDVPPRNVLPKPKQQPHPPVWLACSSPATVENAARLGLGALSFAFTTPEQTKERVEAYYRIIESGECTPIGMAVNPSFALAMPFLCHSDEQTALERGLSGAQFYSDSFSHYYIKGTHHPGFTNLSAAFKARGAKNSNMNLMDQAVRQAIGTPEQIRDVLRVAEESGVDQVIFQVQLGANNHEHICESLRLFAAEVMPEFAGRTEAAEKAKAERLAPALAAARAKVVPNTQDVSEYLIHTDFEQWPEQFAPVPAPAADHNG
jgi:alkanesulfonate monooxygenase SsuD/methylene tetrahydromethanopterin reductase-like flavin-dependent oxidoreductase (luciferase family)